MKGKHVSDNINHVKLYVDISISNNFVVHMFYLCILIFIETNAATNSKKSHACHIADNKVKCYDVILSLIVFQLKYHGVSDEIQARNFFIILLRPGDLSYPMSTNLSNYTYIDRVYDFLCAWLCCL